MNALRKALGPDIERVTEGSPQLDAPKRLLRSLPHLQTLNHDRTFRFISYI